MKFGRDLILLVFTYSFPASKKVVSGGFVAKSNTAGIMSLKSIMWRRLHCWCVSWSSKPWWGSTKSQVGSIPIRLRQGGVSRV